MMHMQSCCFAFYNYCFFVFVFLLLLPSRLRIAKSLLLTRGLRRWQSIPTVYSLRDFSTWACDAYLTGWQFSCLRPASSNRRILDREFSYASLKSRSADLSRTALTRSSTSFSNEASTDTSPSVPDWIMASRPWQCSSKSLKKAWVRN